MSAKDNFLHKLSIVLVVSGWMTISAVWAAGQTSADIKVGRAPAEAPTAYVDDWSHHHLVFSNPGTEADALAKNRYEEWLRITNNPRYQLQQLKRGTPTRPLAPAPAVTETPQDFASRVAAATTPGDFSTRLGIALARPTPSPEPIGSPARRPTSLGQPIKKDWSIPLNGPGSAVATISGNNATSSSTVTINATTLDASPPVAEVDTISVPSATYCIAPGAGVTVGLNAKNVTTNGTVPTGGSITTATTSGIDGGETVAIGGVTYHWVTSLPSGTCGTSTSCILVDTSGGTSNHDDDASSLNAAINAGSQCSWSNPCYALATGQGANAWASSTVSTDKVSLTWQCAGTASLYQITAAGTTVAQPTGGGDGTAGTGVFVIPATASAATLSANINTAIGNDSVTGITKTYTSPTITLTASAAGSTGINTVLDGSVTGVTIATATAGSDGVTNGAATPPTFAYWSGNALAPDTTVASNIATAIGQNTTLNGQVTAAANTDQVTVTAKTDGVSYPVSVNSYSALTWSPTTIQGGAQATVEPNALPALYGQSLTSASCANDWVAYPTGMTGSTTVASIVAYSNIYSSCSGTVPSESWAVNSGGAVTTSPILSLQGDQMAYIQSSGTAATLVLIGWATGGTLTKPLSPTSQTTGALYNSCTPSAGVPCLFKIAFGNGNNDTFSAPFYDNVDDAIYVGDDGGKLHKFTNVFNGSPAEAGAPWPVSLGSKQVSSPVYDITSGRVIVGDYGGFVYSITSGGTVSGITCSSPCVSTAAIGSVIADGPLVDGTTEDVFFFVPIGVGAYFGSTTNLVIEDNVSLTSGFPGDNSLPGSSAGTGFYLYDGSFDNVYYDSPNSSGHIYTVGNPGVKGGATLYSTIVSNGVLVVGGTSAVVSGLNTTAAYPWPSPASEFCNNGLSSCALNAANTNTTSGTDYLFFSVASSGLGGCTASAATGCVLSYILNPASPTGVSGTVTPTSSTVTITAGTVSSADVNGQIYDSLGCIPFGDFITANTTGPPHTVTLSLPAATSGTCTSGAHAGDTLTIVPPPSISGSGLQVVGPGTNGCWATSGIVIDNSDTTTGASQMYFLNFNGTAAGGPTAGTKANTNCTAGASTAIIDAVQTSQANP